MWFQAKSCGNVLSNNIAFNMPRAAINFNDDFGGNTTVVGNLIWNTCRESGDHGPLNSWSRLPFLTHMKYVEFGASLFPFPRFPRFFWRSGVGGEFLPVPRSHPAPTET